MSSTYTVEHGDTLRIVAGKTLGSSFRWPDILAANPWLRTPERQAQQAALELPDREALFFPGEKLVIPKIADVIEMLPESDADKPLIILQSPGNVVSIDHPIAISQGHVMDGLVSGFEFVIPWDNPPAALREILSPDGYHDCRLYIGGALDYQYLIYELKVEISASGARMTVTAYSPAADLVDSSVAEPYELRNINLADLIRAKIKPYGVQLISEISDDPIFSTVKILPTESVFSAIKKYTHQRGCLLSSTPDGNIRLWRAATVGPVATIEEGDNIPRGFVYHYDGRRRYSSYCALAQRPGENLRAYQTDKRVPRTRTLTFAANDAGSAGELDKAVTWRRNRTDALTKARVFPVVGLRTPDGELWRENTLIAIKAPSMGIYDVEILLISRVVRNWRSNYISTDLHLVDPRAYTLGDVGGVS